MKNLIDFRGKKLFCQVTGKGPALVFLHGFLESGEIWKTLSGFMKDLYGYLFTPISQIMRWRI